MLRKNTNSWAGYKALKSDLLRLYADRDWNLEYLAKTLRINKRTGYIDSSPAYLEAVTKIAELYIKNTTKTEEELIDVALGFERVEWAELNMELVFELNSDPELSGKRRLGYEGTVGYKQHKILMRTLAEQRESYRESTRELIRRVLLSKNLTAQIAIQTIRFGLRYGNESIWWNIATLKANPNYWRSIIKEMPDIESRIQREFSSNQ